MNSESYADESIADNSRIVIVGAGHAAGQLVTSLKQKKFAGRIVLIGDEDYLPYQRPPLSKKFLAGELAAERLYVKPSSFYEDDNIELRLGEAVTAIDREAKKLTTSTDAELTYDTLIFATGSRVRELPESLPTLDGIHYLRGIEDVNAIREEMRDAKRIVIIGAGYIGLEVAAVSRTLGLDVTVLEMAERVMSRVVSHEVSDFYAAEHRAQGVKLELSSGLDSFAGDERVRAVITTDGRRIDADLVVVGVGILPNTELAAAAGLDVDNGIVVNDRCQTADPAIYAVGDCTSHPNRVYDKMLRLESVHNALEQAKTAAAAICGEDVSYDQVPWFWSDQYDLKLQIAGLSAGYDEVVLRGDMEQRSFACLYLRQKRLIAIDAINAPRDFMQAKALIARHATPDPAKLADSDILLKDLD